MVFLTKRKFYYTQVGTVFSDPMWDPKQIFRYGNDYDYPIILMCHNWYYHVYDVDEETKAVFIYIFHTRIKPFFPEKPFVLSRRHKIDITTNLIKDSVYVFSKQRKMYCNLMEMHPCFINEISKRSTYLYFKHCTKDKHEDVLFEYDNYVIFMYACLPLNKLEQEKKLIVLEEDGRSFKRTRRHGMIKIYTTNLSFLRL